MSDEEYLVNLRRQVLSERNKNYRVECLDSEKKLDEYLENLRRIADKADRVEHLSKEEQEAYGIVEGNCPARQWDTPFRRLYRNLYLKREELRKEVNLYKNTKKELVAWVKELVTFHESEQYRVIRTKDLEQNTEKGIKRIMELEQELRMVKQEATESVDNVLDFREHKKILQTGGRVPPSGDWLSGMKLGTEFLVRPMTQKSWILQKFMQAGVRNGNVLLIPMQGEAVTAPDNEWLWADPVEFCKVWELKGILLEPVDD
jgi:hypothetical protein